MGPSQDGLLFLLLLLLLLLLASSIRIVSMTGLSGHDRTVTVQEDNNDSDAHFVSEKDPEFLIDELRGGHETEKKPARRLQTIPFGSHSFCGDYQRPTETKE